MARGQRNLRTAAGTPTRDAHTRVLYTRTTDTMRDAIEQLAQFSGLSMSAIVAGILAEAMGVETHLAVVARHALRARRAALKKG